MMKYNKILVTGGAGFIGTNLIKKFLLDGCRITSVDNYSTGLKSNHQPEVVYIDENINKINSLVFKDFDVVYHLAAMARIQPSFEYPERYFNTNVLGTYEVVKFCIRTNTPLIYAGSSSHHSGRFKNPYTFSKDLGEDIIQLYQQHFELKASIVRFYNVYGPHQLEEGGYTTLIGRWEKLLKDGKSVTIYGDGTKRRDFTHVDDIVNGLKLILDKQAWGHTFEFGRGENYSVNEIAKMFKVENPIYAEDKPGEALETLCSDTTAKDVLDWTPVKNIEDYLLEFTTNHNI